MKNFHFVGFGGLSRIDGTFYPDFPCHVSVMQHVLVLMVVGAPTNNANACAALVIDSRKTPDPDSGGKASTSSVPVLQG